MTIVEAIKEIESVELNARVNIASSFENFMSILRDEAAVRELFELMDSRDNVAKIYSRVIELSKGSVDIRYENPRDVAITIYLWLISIQNKELAKMASEVVSNVKQCWWASKMSYSLLREKMSRNEANSTSSVFFITSGIKVAHYAMADSGESLFVGGYDFAESEPSAIWYLNVCGSELKVSGLETKLKYEEDVPFFSPAIMDAGMVLIGGKK